MNIICKYINNWKESIRGEKLFVTSLPSLILDNEINKTFSAKIFYSSAHTLTLVKAMT